MIRVADSRPLRAAVLAVKAANRDLRRDINAATRETMNPEWRRAVADNLNGRDHFTTRLLDNGVRIAAGNPPAAKAAQSKRGIGKSRRLTPAQHYALAEFGASNTERTSTYSRRSRNGGSHTVTRRTRRGLPARNPRGRVIYPAFAEIAPRMVSLWVQLIVRKYHEALEEGS